MNYRPSVSAFALDNRMTVVLFAGMGGGCDGLELAGFHVHLAINHDPIAVAVHKVRLLAECNVRRELVLEAAE
ncbi:hypothetical protein [Agrobacterium vitis]|uniref:hypothetical protein n=1 Tax=Agrobacterium vitis TaxID=373 RepID=UPI0012E84FD4|nr:hypothetical protein [Agrobacterium vitis]MUZ63505.1 hypothetical protein [Agrobacterium vitis]